MNLKAEHAMPINQPYFSYLEHVNSSASLFKIIHAFFSLCVTPPILKHCLTFNKECKKNSISNNKITMKTSETVSQIYTLTLLANFQLCLPSRNCLTTIFNRAFNFPPFLATMFFSHHASGNAIIKSYDVIFFNEMSMKFQ